MRLGHQECSCYCHPEAKVSAGKDWRMKEATMAESIQVVMTPHPFLARYSGP